jgi:tetratricopeptide (TPR) repeat protein
VFVTLARLADRAEQRSELVAAIERVAQRAVHPSERTAWLRRAAIFAGTSEEGVRQRVDVLLRALAVRAEVDLVQALGSAMADLVRLVPDEREILELRFERAATAVLRRAEGPEGARLGIELAVAALGTFDNVTLALRALGSAVDCDGDIEQFAALARHVPVLAPEAEAFATRVEALSRQKFASVGVDLLEFTAALSRERGDRGREARLLVVAAERDPERGDLVRRAEIAARSAGDPELLARVLSAMPDPERLTALLELSRAAEEQGDADGAVESLHQASELGGLDLAARKTLFERSLELFKRLGRRDELEALLVPELARDDLAPEQVVRVARELALVHAARGRPDAALECVLSALSRAPDEMGLLADAVTFARQTGEKRSEVQALSRLVELEPDPHERLEQRRALAELLESLGDEASALVQWTEIHAQVPINSHAIAALERDAERRGDYERVARLLAERASLAQRVDDVRRIRLRRATVLEQRLGRADEARAELEAVLAATGDNLSLLRVLADLDERLGDLLRAAPLWLRASALASDRDEAADLSQRSCRAYLEGGDVEAAHRVLESMLAWVDPDRLLALTVDVERRRENPVGLADALDNLATRSSEMPARRSELLVESARLSLAAGDAERAKERAQRAAGIAPALPQAQLLARYLEYAERGPGSVEQARETVSLLRNIGAELDPEQAELRAFLLAEALDVAEGPAAAGAELGKSRTDILDRPLVALALAERLAATGHPLSALDGFALALDGDLRNLRRPARVALRAAEAARSAGELDRAEQFLERAIGDAETEARARVLLAEVRDERLLEREALASEPPSSVRDADPFHAPPPPPLPAGLSAGTEIGAVRIVSAQPPSRLPPRFTPSGTAAQSGVELPSLSGAYIAPSRTSGGPISMAGMPQSLSPQEPGSQSSERRSSVPPPPPPRTSHLSSTSSGTFSAASPEEIALHRELFDGSVEAGLRLLDRLEGAADRAHDRVAVSRRLALLSPGDPGALERLAAAARADRNPVYAAAIEHVLALVRPTNAVAEPPPIAETPEQPDAIRALLFRETQSRGLEALSLVWEGASHLFRRDPSAYGITGLERIQPTAPTPLAHAYGGASRALGTLRTPLFQRRTAGPVSVNLALLVPPAIVLSGDVQRDTPELRFHLGAMLAAASPQFVLLFGTPEAQARSVLHGLSFAFGPPRPNPSHHGPVLNLAELLWEGIPARMQRRLRELCEDAESLDYEVAMLQARIAVRRAGFFVAGDFGVAAREICADEALPTPRLLGPGGLSELIVASPSLRSLYQLAISPEYAETRWRTARAAPRVGA